MLFRSQTPTFVRSHPPTLRVSKSQKTVSAASHAAASGASIEDGIAGKGDPFRLVDGTARAFFSGIDGLTDSDTP